MTKKELVNIARQYGCASLLGVDTNAKTVKGQKRKFLTGILYLQPDDLLCPVAELAGCAAACLNTAGRGAMSNVQQSRAGRVRLFRERRDVFLALLKLEIEALVRKADRLGMTPVVRLNGTSDINWVGIRWEDGRNVFEIFPEVQFYDYTKRPSNLRHGSLYPNYSVTASYSEVSLKYATMIRKAADKYGANLAVVFPDRESIPETFMGRPVIDGDADDLRFDDPEGVVVALVAKGAAKHDTTGFVIRRDQNLIAVA